MERCSWSRSKGVINYNRINGQGWRLTRQGLSGRCLNGRGRCGIRWNGLKRECGKINRRQGMTGFQQAWILLAFIIGIGGIIALIAFIIENMDYKKCKMFAENGYEEVPGSGSHWVKVK